MMKANLPASIHQRLLDRARAEGRPLNELLQYFAIERFLFRLSQTGYRDLFILKGAQMLRVWNAPVSRPTMDVDLLGKVANDEENLAGIVRECFSQEAHDGVVFHDETITTEQIRKDGDYRGVRISARGSLGTIRLNLQIDVGFGDSVVPGPVEIEFPQLLDFGAPALLGYTPESSIAEKFQAMIALDLANTRMKDFYDVWLLSQSAIIDEKVLSAAIRETFSRRNTDIPTELPTALTPIFTQDETKKKQWSAFLRKNRLDVGLELSEASRSIAELILPLLQINNESHDESP